MIFLRLFDDVFLVVGIGRAAREFIDEIDRAESVFGLEVAYVETVGSVEPTSHKPDEIFGGHIFHVAEGVL